MMPCTKRQQCRAGRLLMTIVIAALVSFSFFVYYYAHLHVLPNGRIVVHSHAMPKGQENGSSHTHSALELSVINQVSLFKTLLITTIPILLVSIVVTFLFPVCSYFIRQSPHVLFSRRGPPAFIA